MKASHFELLVEEQSMETFLRLLLPRILPPDISFEIHTHQGKSDLLRSLPGRLRGYAAWLPADWRLVVLLDRDDQDCVDLKLKLEDIAAEVGLASRSAVGTANWKLVNRIAIEELEAWYFGDWEGIVEAYPRLPRNADAKAGLRDSDAIEGGTWETLERLFKRAGYFSGGLPKLEIARAMGTHLDPTRCASHSFTVFRDALFEAITP